MKEIESLLKRSDRYLKTAELLIDEGDFESSVSRIYYAMFFAAQAALLSKELSFSSHKMTISGFGGTLYKNKCLS
ncbi:MAG: HEPN domain-containing protein [Bacteroidetes bacterium]|nr:HEPN domain-containing protein [Bacteroidota bacterium]